MVGMDKSSFAIGLFNTLFFYFFGLYTYTRFKNNQRTNPTIAPESHRKEKNQCRERDPVQTADQVAAVVTSFLNRGRGWP